MLDDREILMQSRVSKFSYTGRSLQHMSSLEDDVIVQH
jgi:hypothetical protein